MRIGEVGFSLLSFPGLLLDAGVLFFKPSTTITKPEDSDHFLAPIQSLID